jgi:hypothetical protein
MNKGIIKSQLAFTETIQKTFQERMREGIELKRLAEIAEKEAEKVSVNGTSGL